MRELKSWALLVCASMLLLGGAGCGGDPKDPAAGDAGVAGGDGGTGLDSGSPVVTISVSPAKSYVNVPAEPIVLTASVEGSDEPVSWKLEYGGGSLSAATGASVTYTPPSSVGSLMRVAIAASVAGASASALVEVDVELIEKRPLPAKRFVPFNRVVELLVLGADFSGTGEHNQFLVDPYKVFGKITTEPPVLPDGYVSPTEPILDARFDANFGARFRKVAKAGNFDDDFEEEVAVVSWPDGEVGTGTLTLVDAGRSGFANLVPAGLDLTIADAATDRSHYDLALGDLDGDGYDEIVVVGSLWDGFDGLTDGYLATGHSGRMWILDDGRHGYAQLATVELKGHDEERAWSDGILSQRWQGVVNAEVAVGRVLSADAEGNALPGPQIAVAWYDGRPDPETSPLRFNGRVYGALYDGAGAPIAADLTLESGGFTGLDLSVAEDHDYLDLTLMDLDRDGARELTLGIINAQRTEVETKALVGFYRPTAAGEATALRRVAIEQLDSLSQDAYDGEHPEEFLFTTPEADGTEVVWFGPSRVKLSGDEYMIGTWGLLAEAADIQFGDLNGDRSDELIVLRKDGTIHSEQPWDHSFYDAGTAGPDRENLILVPVNVDGDSLLVEYKGDAPQRGDAWAHSIVYRDDKLIALIAAPPVHDDLGQSESDSCTTFGTAEGTSISAGASFSARAGVVIGFETEASAGFVVNHKVFSFEATVGFQLEATASYTWSGTTEESISYSAPSGTDMVLFSATPYDRYTYKVVSSPVPGAVEQDLYFDLPRPTRTYFWDREYFNKVHAGQLQITKDLQPHTPYDLASYPKFSDLQAMQTVDIGLSRKYPVTTTAIYETEPVEVSVNGTVEKSVTLSQSNAFGAEVVLSCDVNARAVTGGVVMGANFGISIGGFYETSTSSATSFTTTIAGIPAENYQGNQYSWSMYAYRQQIHDGDPALPDEGIGEVMQDYLVINFAVTE